MNKPIKKLYYSIGEVSQITGLKQYVLRYWETEFPSLSPSKNRAGNRVYREKDIQIIQFIKHLLYDKKFTIEGARQKLKETGTEELGKFSEEGLTKPDEKPQNDQNLVELIRKVKEGLEEILELLHNW